MIPLRDTVRSRTIPFVNYLFIGTCGLVFLYELSLGSKVEFFFQRFGVIPLSVSSVVQGASISLAPLVRLVTSMFLHGGWAHLIGNMLFLQVFGDNVEDRIGHLRYFFFYVLAGIGASLVEVYFHPVSSAPLIGASGAISGVMGAYLLLHPKAKVMTLIPLIIFFPIVEVPAFVFLGLWLMIQIFQGSAGYGAGAEGGIAWWAHAGGFVVGAVLLPVFLLIRRR